MPLVRSSSISRRSSVSRLTRELEQTRINDLVPVTREISREIIRRERSSSRRRRRPHQHTRRTVHRYPSRSRPSYRRRYRSASPSYWETVTTVRARSRTPRPSRTLRRLTGTLYIHLQRAEEPAGLMRVLTSLAPFMSYSRSEYRDAGQLALYVEMRLNHICNTCYQLSTTETNAVTAREREQQIRRMPSETRQETFSRVYEFLSETVKGLTQAITREENCPPVWLDERQIQPVIVSSWKLEDGIFWERRYAELGAVMRDEADWQRYLERERDREANDDVDSDTLTIEE